MKKSLYIYLIVILATLSIACRAGVDAVNVRSFGAKGNGVADDTKAIHAAFAAIASTGGKIYFPSGIYLVDVIDIRPEKFVSITVEGDGERSIVKLKANPQNPVAVFFCEVPDVKLHFNKLTIDGSASAKPRPWKITGPSQAEVDQQVNGIYAYNVAELTVTNCSIKQLHGDGIACYSAKRFVANDNTLADLSGTGIKGHRVLEMIANHNSISNCGMLASSYVLNGMKKVFDRTAPNTKFGDGIEAASQKFEARNNTILNPGRCGIVHDLAQDLNYTNSTAIVINNTILINSDKINSNNPPAGMWFEQTARVTVNNNSIKLVRSKNMLTSAIRFFDITESISCLNNNLSADSYNGFADNAIGIFEPRMQAVKLTGNRITGKFKSAIVVSYGKPVSGIKSLIVDRNTILGKGLMDNGVWMSLSQQSRMPGTQLMRANQINGVKAKPYKVSRYGQKNIVK